MANDTKNSILNGYLPSGLYYYFIPAENPIQYSGFLGNAPCVETVTYNPFISKKDLKTPLETTFDEDRFGDIDSNTNKLIRVKHIAMVDKELCDIRTYTNEVSKLPYYLRRYYKLQTYPYTYYVVTDYMNTPLVLKPQEIENINIYVKSTLSREGYYMLYCKGNKGDNDGTLEGIICKNAMQLPVTSSYYSQFISSQMNTFASQNNLALMENDISYKYDIQMLNQNNRMLDLDKQQLIVNATSNAIDSAIDLNLGSAIFNGATTGINLSKQQVQEKVNNITRNNINAKNNLKEESIYRLTNAKVKDAQSTPNSLKTMGNDIFFNAFNSKFKIDVIKYQVDKASLKRIADYFHRYGYKVNKYQRINLKVCDKFTYVKTGICNIQGSNIPKDYLNQIRAIFNNGLTFWNMETKNNFVGNYITNNNLL